MSLVQRPPVLVMETDVAPVPAGGPKPGWVSGTPVSLAGNATVNCIFDLGPDWDQYTLVQICVNCDGPSTSFAPVQAFGSDSVATPTSLGRRLAPPSNTGGSALFATVNQSNPQTTNLKPFGRYFTVQVKNADATNAGGPLSKVTVGAYPA